MWSEILKILPKLDTAALNSMENSLGNRFTRIAKKFGKGLTASLAGGGIAGLALGLIDKLLNPLKETQEAIDRVLSQGDDLVTNAKQFGTTAGKLFRLQQLAKSTGLDEGSLAVLIQKFQASIAEATADPTKQTAVRKFVEQAPIDPKRPELGNKAVAPKDIAESFFQFIQSLQKMDKNQQVLVQQEVFGEKQILKMADFLQTDFEKQSKLLGGPTSEQLTPRLNKLGDLNDLKDLLAARRTLNDTFKKGGVINAGMVRSQDEQAKQELQKENNQIKGYQDLAAISMASTELVNLGKDLALKGASMLVKLTDLVAQAKALTNSRWVRGLLKLGGD